MMINPILFLEIASDAASYAHVKLVLLISKQTFDNLCEIDEKEGVVYKIKVSQSNLSILK